MFAGIWNGTLKTLNFGKYNEIITQYKNDFNMSEWVLTGIAISTILLFFGIIIAIVVIFIRKHTNLRNKIETQEEMLEQLAEEKEQLIQEQNLLRGM